MEIKDVNAFIQQWKIDHNIYGELNAITEEMEEEWLRYFFDESPYQQEESELEEYVDYIAGAGSGRYYNFISASTKVTKAVQSTMVVANTTPVSYNMSTNKWSYKTQAYCLDPVDKIVNVANLFTIDDVYSYLKKADATDDPEERISKILLGSAMAATYAIIPLSFGMKLSAEFLKIDKLSYTGIKDVFTKFFTKIENLESPIVSRFPIASDDVYTAPTVLTRRQKIGTALGNHYGKVLKAYSLLVMDPLWLASSIYDYQKAQNGDGVTATEQASLASSVLFLGSDHVSVTGMVTDSIKAVGTAAKALKVAGTVCSVVGTILEAGAYIALAATRFTSLDSDSSSEEIALAFADPALQLGLMA